MPQRDIPWLIVLKGALVAGASGNPSMGILKVMEVSRIFLAVPSDKVILDVI